MSTYLRLQPPPGLSPRFFFTAGLYKQLSQQKKSYLSQRSGSPTGSRPRSVVYSFCCSRPPPPRGGGSRSGISPVCNPWQVKRIEVAPPPPKEGEVFQRTLLPRPCREGRTKELTVFVSASVGGSCLFALKRPAVPRELRVRGLRA
jgi:hypothetical protein